MAFTIYIMVLVAYATFSSAEAVEEVGNIAPAPIQSAGAAMGVPVAVAAIASLLAWFF